MKSYQGTSSLSVRSQRGPQRKQVASGCMTIFISIFLGICGSYWARLQLQFDSKYKIAVKEFASRFPVFKKWPNFKPTAVSISKESSTATQTESLQCNNCSHQEVFCSYSQRRCKAFERWPGKGGFKLWDLLRRRRTETRLLLFSNAPGNLRS